MVLFSRLRRHFVFWIAVAYLGVVGTYLFLGSVFGGEELKEQRAFALQHVLRMSRPLVKDNRSRELSRYLKDAVSTGMVDYFELSQGEKIESQGSVPSRRPVLTDAFVEKEGWVWGRAEGADLSLRLASGYGWNFRLFRAWEATRTRMPYELLFLAIISGLGLYFQGNARRQAAYSVAEGFGKRQGRRAKVVLADTSRMRISEPKEFSGICGRGSLLNQAEVASYLSPEDFFVRLEEFYADAAALVSRYKGKMYAVHGHELLFFVSVTDEEQQARLAFAAARDLQRMAEKRGFSQGIALAHGRLHGGNLLSGFALFGEPVEKASELARLQSAHMESAIWVTNELKAVSDSFARFRAVPGVRKHHASVLEPESMGGLASLVAACKQGNVAGLAFHRGDDALVEILRSLAMESDWNREAYVTTISELRQVHCRRCGAEVHQAYRSLLEAELEHKDSYRLSSVLALAPQILSRSSVNSALEKLFLKAVALKDRRVRANAVELFTRFFPEREIPELRPLLRDEDNRVSANALIKAACERFDEKVIAKIEERVRGGSVAHVASALHAMGEIAVYYRKHDPLFLGTKIEFLQLFDLMPSWASHPNPMIRRQALIAAQKLESEVLNARLRELFATCEDPELLGLFESIYGWRKQPVASAAKVA